MTVCIVVFRIDKLCFCRLHQNTKHREASHIIHKHKHTHVPVGDFTSAVCLLQYNFAQKLLDQRNTLVFSLIVRQL